jgi:hypothetical protein
MAQLLPEDVIADVLRHVPPRSLAACRCVCKALQDTIDARGLLRVDLLPLSVRGIFINFFGVSMADFFSRPSTSPTISGRFDYLPIYSSSYCFGGDFGLIQDHCNGLLLLKDYVVNPATRQWHSLPPRPSMSNQIDRDFLYEEYLVYDPTVSPHYEVLRISRRRIRMVWRGDFSNNWTEEAEPVTEDSEWPPSVFALHVFSSRSGFWEERNFTREGKVVSTISTMRVPGWEISRRRYAVYWRQALYVHCEADFIMRYLTTL